MKLDLPELRQVTSLLGRYGNNLNQIAKKVNMSGRIYGEEITMIQRGHIIGDPGCSLQRDFSVE